jgi:hypothetical protein
MTLLSPGRDGVLPGYRVDGLRVRGHQTELILSRSREANRDDPSPPRTRSESQPAAFGAPAVRAVLIALAGGAGLFLAWMAADALLLIFAGLLFAALLDFCTRGLARLLPISRG